MAVKDNKDAKRIAAASGTLSKQTLRCLGAPSADLAKLGDISPMSHIRHHTSHITHHTPHITPSSFIPAIHSSYAADSADVESV